MLGKRKKRDIHRAIWKVCPIRGGGNPHTDGKIVYSAVGPGTFRGGSVKKRPYKKNIGGKE